MILLLTGDFPAVLLLPYTLAFHRSYFQLCRLEHAIINNEVISLNVLVWYEECFFLFIFCAHPAAVMAAGYERANGELLEMREHYGVPPLNPSGVCPGKPGWCVKNLEIGAHLWLEYWKIPGCALRPRYGILHRIPVPLSQDLIFPYIRIHILSERNSRFHFHRVYTGLIALVLDLTDGTLNPSS